ncbi:MAG: translocation/assembly module TamB domain-containing protein, partial [Pyrinomonadaceae bacterium]
GQLSANAARASAQSVTAAGGVSISGAQASGVRVKTVGEGGFDASASSVSTGAVQAEGTRLSGVSASGVTAVNRGGVTNVVAESARVGGGALAGAQIGSLNVAGVRLAIYDSGRIEGSTGDVNVGTVAFKTNTELGEGRVENVRLGRPAFVVEPSGRYRASADLSLGGGVLGEIPLGAARAQVVATGGEVQLRNFTAEAMGGRAAGDATISTARGGASRVSARFENLDAGKLLALLSGRTVPVTGAATGTVDLRFPGTNIELASGTLNTEFTGETGDEARGRTPLTGALTVRADRGLFQLGRANLRAGQSELTATGQFSFEGDSNLQINLASADAAELQRVVIGSGLLGDLEETLSNYGVELAGNLDFNGTVRGSLSQPVVDGRISVGALNVNGRNLGQLTASIRSDANNVNVPDGRLAGPDGGSIQFALNAPLRSGQNTGTVEATLERYDLGRLLAALPNLQNNRLTSQLAAAGPTSGQLSVRGFPGEMSGSASLRSGPGRIGNEPFDELTARATFNGSVINLENFDLKFQRGGRVNAAGTVDAETTRFDLRASGNGVNVDLIESLIANVGGRAAPALDGTVDFTANLSGVFADSRSYQIEFNAEGRDVVVNGQRAGALTLAGRTENQRLNVTLTTGLIGGPERPQVITAQVDLSDPNLPARIETTLNATDLTPLFAALLPSAQVSVTGRATGTLVASGNLISGEDEEFGIGGLSGTANFTELAVQVEDVQLTAESPLVVKFSPEEVFFERTRFTGPGTNVVFGGTAALGAGGRQNFTVDGDVNLRVFNGVSPNVFLAGTARVGVRVGGTFAEPRLNGTATVANATFSLLLEDERLTAQNLNGSVRFTADRAQLDELTGTLGGGRFTLTGGASLAGFALEQFRLNLRGENITVPFPDQFRTTADADLSIQGTPRARIITGTLSARRVEYTEDIDLADFIDRREEATLTEGMGLGGLAAGTQLDVRVEGRDALVVRNNLADMTGSIALQIRGTLEEPLIAGRITATRGTINFRNDRYEITRAIIDLPPRRDADPVVNIQAESEIQGYRVIVGLTGPLTQLTATPRAEPALPQADVIALITTGNLATGDTGGSTLAQTGFGTATSLLTETLISDPVERATDRLFGLNRFEIDPLITGRGGASPTARLTVGRQINRNLSVTYSTNLTTDKNQVVAFEYRVSDRLSVVARYEQGPVNTLRAQDDNFSLEVRFRKRF